MLTVCVLGAVCASELVSCADAGFGVQETASTSASKSFTAMDTAMTITVNASEQSAADDVVEACRERILELDEALAPENEGSEIAQLNAAGGSAVPASQDMVSLVSASLKSAQLSGGAFDPTIYPLTKAWGFTSGDHRLPSPDEIASLLPRVGYEAVQVNKEADTISLANKAQLDAGGVAKGFAADELRALLQARGINSALFDLGGNVTAIGSKPDGSPWKVGIANPHVPELVAGSMELSDATASTSGAYQRFFEGSDGTRYHHLLDPKTGYPATSDLLSATVVGPSGVQCDALSTACFVLGLDASLDLWRESTHDGLPVFDLVLITADGSTYVTPGVAKTYTAADGFTVVEVAL